MHNNPLPTLLIGVAVVILGVKFSRKYAFDPEEKRRRDLAEVAQKLQLQFSPKNDFKLPNLVAMVKGYAAHEKSTLERVTELRNRCASNQGSPAEQAGDENQLVDALRQFHVVIENYPQLKADRQFLKLQQELANTENRIQAARRFYNGNVRDYRNKCEMFPGNVVAKLFGFKSEGDFFTVPPSVREVPNVEFNRPA